MDIPKLPDIPSAFTFGGVTIPLSAFKPLLAAGQPIIDGIKAKKTPHEIIADVEAAAGPAAIAVLETVANAAFPGGGTAVGLIVWALEHQKPMTQDEENAWMDRFSATSDRAS